MSNDAHARPSGDAEAPLYDPDVPTPSHAERARTLASRLGTGTLCTVTNEPEGYPYGSFVTFALQGPDPVFLISGLAEHTKNLKRDPRASLLVAESRAADPLANGRVTLLGPCTPVDDGDAAGAREVFLAAHPGASYYVDYRDFGFFRLHTQSIRYIGGYGRMSWVTGDAFRDAEPDPLAEDAQGIIDHMNADHADTMVTMARAFTRASDTSAAAMTSVDRYGFELSVTTGAGPRPVRLAFDSQVHDKTAARKAIVAMVKAARAKLAPT